MSEIIKGTKQHELHQHLTYCSEIEYRRYNQKRTMVPFFYIDFIYPRGKANLAIQATTDIEEILTAFIQGEYTSPLQTT